MNKLIDNVAKFFNSLTKVQQLITSVIVLLLLILLVNLLSNFNVEKGIINYREVTSVTSLIENKEVVSNREIYYDCEVIVKNLLNTYLNNYYIDNEKVTTRQYYDYALEESYKVRFSNLSFKKKVNNFANKVLANNKAGELENILGRKVINKVYEYSYEESMYIVELNTLTQENAYLGIRFDYATSRFYIFYIE